MKLALLASTLALAACGSPLQDAGNDLNERAPGTSSTSWQNQTLVNNSLGASRAVRINARTNYLTYYENGVPKSKWKVATARPGKETPKGIFAIHAKDVCPPWSLNGISAAGCADNNPLGKKALWFFEGGIYGMHGVDLGHLSSVTAANPRDRDQSSGCVRNHPENIEWLFNHVNVGTPVVVGLWDSDPAVVDCSGNAAACSGNGPGVGGGGSLLPNALPAWCAINVSEGAGRGNVRSQANTTSTVVSELKRDSKVKVVRKEAGQSVAGSADWYFVEFTLGGPKTGYLHSSLLDCTR